MSTSTTTAGGEKSIYTRDKLVEIRDSMELLPEGEDGQTNTNQQQQQQSTDLSWRKDAGKDIFPRSGGGFRGGDRGAEGERPPRGDRPDRNLERGGQQAPAGSGENSRMNWDRDRPPRNEQYGRGGGFRGAERDGKPREQGGNFRNKDITTQKDKGGVSAPPTRTTGGYVSSPTASSPVAPTSDETATSPSSSSNAAPKKNPWGNRSVPTSSQATALASAPAPLAAADVAQAQAFPTFSQSVTKNQPSTTGDKNSSSINSNGGSTRKAPPPPIASLDDLSSPTVPSPSVAPPAPVALGDDDCGLPGLPRPGSASGRSPIAPSPAAVPNQKNSRKNSNTTASSAPSPTMALGALGGVDDDDSDFPMLGAVGNTAPQGRKQRQQQQLNNQQQQNSYSRRPVPKVVPVTQRSDLKESEFPSLETL